RVPQLGGAADLEAQHGAGALGRHAHALLERHRVQGERMMLRAGPQIGHGLPQAVHALGHLESHCLRVEANLGVHILHEEPERTDARDPKRSREQYAVDIVDEGPLLWVAVSILWTDALSDHVL